MAVVHLIKVPLYKNNNLNFYIKYKPFIKNHPSQYRRRTKPYLDISSFFKSPLSPSTTSTNLGKLRNLNKSKICLLKNRLNPGPGRARARAGCGSRALLRTKGSRPGPGPGPGPG